MCDSNTDDLNRYEREQFKKDTALKAFEDDNINLQMKIEESYSEIRNLASIIEKSDCVGDALIILMFNPHGIRDLLLLAVDKFSETRNRLIIDGMDENAVNEINNSKISEKDYFDAIDSFEEFIKTL